MKRSPAPEKSYEEFNAGFSEMYRFVLNFTKYIRTPRDYLAGTGITVSDVHILALIVDHPGMTVTELAREWRCTTGAICQVLTRLTKKELVLRKRLDGNAKEVHLYPTPEGAALVERHKQYNIRFSQTMLQYTQDLSQQELDAFFSTMGKLNRNNDQALL